MLEQCTDIAVILHPADTIKVNKHRQGMVLIHFNRHWLSLSSELPPDNTMKSFSPIYLQCEAVDWFFL